MPKFLQFALVLVVCSSFALAQPTVPQPPWSQVAALRTISLDVATSNDLDRGKALVEQVAKLQPGDALIIAAGTYSVNRLWDITCRGTADAPIRITAKPGTRVVITRPDNRQNVMNVGMQQPIEYVVFEGLEITGGSHGVRLGAGRDVWFHRCHIHHTAGVCLSANSEDTQRIYFTNNTIHHPGGTAEGMYLGGNDGSVVMSESVIAGNHVYECRGSQGDGIELKQGSWGNRIAMNVVHDCNYPCITVYGTAGKRQNVIERNLCLRSQDAAMQVQGEAIVRNNILISGGNGGFVSTDHQGKTTNLQVIHNTIINTGHAFRGGSWNDRSGMVLANNVIYSRDQNALHFPNGAANVHITGNLLLGHGHKHNSKLGKGIQDFVRLSWDAKELTSDNLDATPREVELFAIGNPEFQVTEDFSGRIRKNAPVLSGATNSVK